MGIVYSTAGQILQWLVNGADLGEHQPCYLGLSLRAPSNTGLDFQEVPSEVGGVSTNYARLPVYIYQQVENKWNLNSIGDGRISNKDYFMFNEAQTNWGTILGFGFFRSSTDGTPYLVGSITGGGVEVLAQRVALFRPDNMIISIDRPTLLSISCTPNVGSAFVGQTIAWPNDEQITATYNDSTSSTIELNRVTTSPAIGGTWSTEGQQTMTVTFTEDGVTKTDTITYTILPAQT